MSGVANALGGQSFGSAPGVPGFVDEFSTGALGSATGSAETAMANRGTQLGLGTPAGPNAAQGASASGGNLPFGGFNTPMQMDLGQLPSLVGGIPGMSAATLGQMQNAALNQPISNAGGKSGSGGGLAGLLGL
jgi:hypothetical protein